MLKSLGVLKFAEYLYFKEFGTSLEMKIFFSDIHSQNNFRLILEIEKSKLLMQSLLAVLFNFQGLLPNFYFSKRDRTLGYACTQF